MILSLIAMQVEGSRQLVQYHKVSSTSVDRLKIAEAYSGPSNGGIGHAIMHNTVFHTTPSNGFKIIRANSGPSRGGAGHGLTNLLRNLSSTPFKRFESAKHSGPSDSGTGH